MDWWPILLALPATFFGSFLGFISSWVLTKRQEKARLIEVRSSLDYELEKILRIFDNLNPDNQRIQKTFFDTPVWNSLVSSGGLLALLEADRVYFTQALMIYSKIKEIEQMPGEVSHETKRYEKISEVIDEIKRFKG
ncbi:MAG: hypothetical protein LBE35_04875 [Clostridiales bacterium]|jgi:hypothetical protein|nr:hypothetical protein [Clostridiales bacterium]